MRKLIFILFIFPLFGLSQTSIFTCGFECGNLGTGGEHFSLSAGTATISTSTVRNGSRSLRVNPSAAAMVVSSTALTSSGIWVIRTYLYFSTLPSGNTLLVHAPIDNGGISNVGAVFRLSDNSIYAGIGNGAAFGATGVAVTTGQWYRVDVKINCAANPWTIDVKVNGTDCAQRALATTAGTSTTFKLGCEGSVTADVFYDDILVSQTSGDYPLGGGYVNHFVPTSDGTHNVAGTNDFEIGTGGVDINNASTTAWQLLDDVPMQSGAPGTTDFINLIAPPNSTDYVEVVFGPASGISVPTVAPRAVEAIVGHASSATGTNNIRLALNDNGTTNDVANGSYHGATTSILYHTKHYIDPPSAASVWTLSGNGNFNNVRMRCLTSDAAPDPYFTSAMLEAEFVDVPLTVPGTPGDKRHTNLGVGLIYSQNIFNKTKLIK